MSLFSLFFYHQTLHNIHYIVFIMLPNLSGSLYNLVHIMVSIICRCVCIHQSGFNCSFFVVCSCFTSFKRFFCCFFIDLLLLVVFLYLFHLILFTISWLKSYFKLCSVAFYGFVVSSVLFFSLLCVICVIQAIWGDQLLLFVSWCSQRVCVGVCVSTFHMCHDSFDL